MPVTLIDYLYLPKSIKKVNGGVLIERAQYYTILVDGVRTIQEGVLIEEGALTNRGSTVFTLSKQNLSDRLSNF